MQGRMATRRRVERSAPRRIAAVALAAALVGGEAGAQLSTDFCGCEGSPNSLGDFHSNDPATWPPGSQQVATGCSPILEIPLPEDGVLIFDSFTVGNMATSGCGTVQDATVRFAPNPANTPVTLLVRGNVTIESGDLLSVNGFAGSNGTTGSHGTGGRGGPGGFAGGDGAYQLSNLAADGGYGIGPGGGAGGTGNPRERSQGGVFFGVPGLRPLVGGSGGGGGHSASAASGCAGGGGGGGGGALLLAANGTVTVNGTISANGGGAGNRNGSGCSSNGSGGSGGAIRILASVLTGSGSITATGGGGGSGFGGMDNGSAGGPGRIRLEAITNTFAVNGTNPVAVRAPAPGPLVNPITPTVSIVAIDGQATPLNPIGHRGLIDLVVPSPGPIQIDLESTDVPAGTDLEVTVRPKVGRPPIQDRVTLSPGACSGGVCQAAIVFDLDPGAYIVEARATFEAP